MWRYYENQSKPIRQNYFFKNKAVWGRATSIPADSKAKLHSIRSCSCIFQKSAFVAETRTDKLIELSFREVTTT